MDSELAKLVVRSYPIEERDCQVTPWTATHGLSGAQFWMVETPPAQRYCLRRSPPGFADNQRLTWIRSVLQHAQSNGFEQLAIPLLSRQGTAWVEAEGALWQLSPWLAGEPDVSAHSSLARVEQALAALARYHVAVEAFPDAGLGESRSLTHRYQSSQSWQSPCDLRVIAAKLIESDRYPRKAAALDYLRRFPSLAMEITSELQLLVRAQHRLLPALRDVWRPHLFFDGDAVTGLIDYDALRIDSPAVCISRLLASMAADDAARWEAGIHAYQRIRPLSRQELRLIRALDLAATLLTSMQWLRWICLEKRQFANGALVSQRIEETSLRFDRWVTGGHVWHQLSGVEWIGKD